jgi:putative nucleotidyltransferase with HDIG domain
MSKTRESLKAIDVLILEDWSADAELMEIELRMFGFAPSCRRVSAAKEYVQELESPPDIILADFSMPQFDAIKALELLQEHELDIPFIIVSGSISEEAAVGAMRAGASDYLLKDRMARLGPAVEHALDEKLLRDEKRRRERERELLVTIADSMRTASSLRELLPVMLSEIDDMFENTGSAIAIEMGQSGALRIEGASGLWETKQGHHLRGQTGIWCEAYSAQQTIVAEAPFEEGYIFATDAAPAPEAIICIPMVAQGERLGALLAGRIEAFQDEDIVLLNAIADMAANSIRQVVLLEQTTRRLKRLTALRRIDMAISGSLDLSITLNVLLEQIDAQTVVDAASVLLLDDSTELLVFAAARGYKTEQLETEPIRVGHGLAGEAMLTGKTAYISNLASAADQFTWARELVDRGFKSYFGSPLVAQGHVVGLLETYHLDEMADDPEWTDFIEALAAQTAIAISNARLFEGMQKANSDLAFAYNQTLEGWSRALEMKDDETEGHSQRVTDKAVELARDMGFNNQELTYVRWGALLHDIGKIAIPDNILLKEGPLSDEEWAVMRRHPTYAQEMLQEITFLGPAMDIPRYHHEKWNGSGYPARLAGEAIPLSARIFAVVDVWDALSSSRPYRPEPWPQQKIIRFLKEQSGEHFDPAVVNAFIKMLDSAV